MASRNRDRGKPRPSPTGTVSTCVVLLRRKGLAKRPRQPARRGLHPKDPPADPGLYIGERHVIEKDILLVLEGNRGNQDDVTDAAPFLIERSTNVRPGQ
jgi:hypothetical protein